MIELPVRFPLDEVCRLTNAESVRLFREIRKLDKSEFRLWMTELVGGQLAYRNGAANEPAYQPVPITSGKQLSVAWQQCRQLSAMKMSRRAQALMVLVSNWITAMIESYLECSTNDDCLLLHRRGISNTSQVLLLPSEASAMLGISEGSLARLVNEESFPRPIRVGRKRYWTESSVQNFINRQADNSANEE
jgi:predicted DNA-binding transcriptional regulator AlpA